MTTSKRRIRVMGITSHLFEAILQCPAKCWLRSAGEAPAGNPYAQWVAARSDLDFLRSGEKDVRAFAESRRKRRPTHAKPPGAVSPPTA